MAPASVEGIQLQLSSFVFVLQTPRLRPSLLVIHDDGNDRNRETQQLVGILGHRGLSVVAYAGQTSTCVGCHRHHACPGEADPHA